MNALSIAFRTLLREWKSGELGVLILAITVAVSALTGVGFLVDRIGVAIDNQAGEVLAADDLLIDMLREDGANRFQQFNFFVADWFGLESDGWFHSDEGEDLQEMVLHHVANGSGFFVITAAATYS
jgi:hypothetical protein